MINAHDSWQLANVACRRIGAVFNAYGAAVKAEPIARDYTSHWGFFPILEGRVVGHSTPVFVEKITGSVLPYGTVPRGNYTDYLSPDPKIAWSRSVPIVASR